MAYTGVSLQTLPCIKYMGIDARKPGLLHIKTKATDQAVHVLSVIFGFVIRSLQSIILKFASYKKCVI